MKLIIRTAYWGQVLRGKTLDRVSPGAKQSRSISSQAVIKNEGQFWGCCPTQGKRVLEMTEQHFLDAYDGDWDLYYTGLFVDQDKSQQIHSFWLFPQNQNSVDITQGTGFYGWKFFGTIPASQMREKLHELLYESFFKPNDELGYRVHHVHIEILMNEVIDHAAREKKARAKSPVDGSDAPSVASKPSVDGTNDSATPTSRKVPPLTRSDSNEGSLITEKTSSPLTCPPNEAQFTVPVYNHPEMICAPVPVNATTYPMIPGHQAMSHMVYQDLYAYPVMHNMAYVDPYAMAPGYVPMDNVASQYMHPIHPNFPVYAPLPEQQENNWRESPQG